ncbi:MAG: hypothetical protein ACQEXJ_20180 [Myxococcota bacterium]
METRVLGWFCVALAALLWTGCTQVSEEGSLEHGTPEIHTAVAELEAVGESGVSGDVKLTQASGVSGPRIRDRATRVTVTLSLEGVDRGERYDVSLHEHGACDKPASDDEDRFDPGGVEGAGELGRVDARSREVEKKLTAKHLSVARGTEPERSALGKTLVVRNADGERIACGVIRPD